MADTIVSWEADAEGEGVGDGGEGDVGAVPIAADCQSARDIVAEIREERDCLRGKIRRAMASVPSIFCLFCRICLSVPADLDPGRFAAASRLVYGWRAAWVDTM